MRHLGIALGLGLVLALAVVGLAQGAYEGASGGTATPSAFAVNGGTDYSVSLTGKAATVDLELVLDNSGSMSELFGGGESKWAALQTASDNFVDGLETEGFFARGGKVGVVFFSEGAAGISPTSNVATIKEEIAKANPGGGSCITCGLKMASELLAAVPGSSTHKRIAYIVADGGNSGSSPTVSEAVASAEAAGVERRVIGMGSGASGAHLEEFASDGTVAQTSNSSDLAAAYSAQSTHLPGATNLSWAFHLTPGFTASSPSASVGSATAAGGEVTWTIPSLGEGTATLTFHASHDPGAGCGATSLLSGTTFSDAEGDAAPTVALGPISISGCAGPGTTVGKSGSTTTVKPSSVILLPKPPSGCTKRHSIRVKLKPPRGTGIAKATVKVTGQKTKTYSGAKVKSAIVISGLPTGHYKVTVTVKLKSGQTLKLSQRYLGCPA